MISAEELIQSMELYETGKCPYLPEQSETIRAMRCPGLPDVLHAELIERGFRHSDDVFYLPECKNCRRCISMRIDPALFRPSKKQRHIFHKNADLEIHISSPQVTEEKLDIYRRYMDLQHAGSVQDNSMNSLSHLYVELPSSAEVTYILGDRVIGVTLADIIPYRAFSSVYHYFDPDYARRSIGTFSMVAEIRLTQALGIPWFYPGFWVPECRKMQYKAQFRPNQILIDGVWVDHE